MSRQASVLRRSVQEIRRSRRPRGRRYPAELRGAIVAHALAARRHGSSLRSIAAGLGLPYERLRRWLAGSGPGFRAVALESRAATLEASGLHLITAQGHRVEGLSREDLLLILRALS